MPERQHNLIGVLGRTPQILTETLYNLCVVQKIPIAEVWMITTQEGYREARENLLDPKTGQFYRMGQDYPTFCRQIHFTPEHILVAQDGLMPISDIRNRKQSENFLELIMRVLWEKSADPNVTLHCSLAGGRKTMSTYLALALQLLGRPQDRLYHVLVDPPELENHPEFFYPPPHSKPIRFSDNHIVDAHQARIDLVDIPFIRLRERVHVDKLHSPVGYRQLLEWVQTDLNQALSLPPLILDRDRHALRIGASEIILQPQRFCLYWYFADRSRQRPPDLAVENYSAYFDYPQGSYFSHAMRDCLLQRFRALDPSDQMYINFREKVLDHGELPMSWVLQGIARINKQIRLGLPNAYVAPFYLISAEGKRGGKCYGIRLEGRIISTPETEVR
jgi:CRISPR-associated protein (TIGR02584 family)